MSDQEYIDKLLQWEKKVVFYQQQIQYFKDTHVGLYGLDVNPKDLLALFWNDTAINVKEGVDWRLDEKAVMIEKGFSEFVEKNYTIRIGDEEQPSTPSKLIGGKLPTIMSIILFILMSFSLNAQTFTTEQVKTHSKSFKYEDRVTSFDVLILVDIDTVGKVIVFNEGGKPIQYYISRIFNNTNGRSIMLTDRKTPTWFALEDGKLSLVTNRRNSIITRKFSN